LPSRDLHIGGLNGVLRLQLDRFPSRGLVVEAGDEELVRAAVEQFYNKEGQPPKELLVPTTLDDAALLEQWLSEKRGDAVRILAPERGTKHQLVLLAEENAGAAVADHLRNEALDRQATAELKRLLRLDIVPRRMIFRTKSPEIVKGFPPDGHVAARDVLCGGIREQHMGRAAG